MLSVVSYASSPVASTVGAVPLGISAELTAIKLPPLIAPEAVREVPVATPNTGVTNVGVFANTAAPVPVSSVKAAIRFALDGVANTVATPVPRPLTPVLIGKPVAFVNVPEVGVPKIGVTNVGVFANTAAPVPVSSVKAAIRFALDGVANTVATPVPKPLTPVLIGKPVAFVNVPEVGVPNIGVTNVGEVANTANPEPVSSESTPANCAELVVAKADKLLEVVAKVPDVGNVKVVVPVVVKVVE